MGSQLRWLERTPDKREVDGSIPFEPTITDFTSVKSTLKNIQMKNKVNQNNQKELREANFQEKTNLRILQVETSRTRKMRNNL